MGGWQDISTAPLNTVVETKIHDADGERNHVELKGICRIPGETRTMWLYPDGSMYVYYTPTHWRSTAPGKGTNEGGGR